MPKESNADEPVFVASHSSPEARAIDWHYRKGCEFVDGRWIEKNGSMFSDRVGLNLIGALIEYVRPRRLGRVQGPLCGYRCFPNEALRVRVPDVSFVTVSRFAQVSPDQAQLYIPPDFIAEIICEHDLAEFLEEKIQDFLSVGTKLVWTVFPRQRLVMVRRPNDRIMDIARNGELTCGDIIPGFTISLDTLFADD